MDYIRHIEVFDPDTFKTPVHVIGAGATGSWLVLMLAKLGIKDIHVWDFDIIEEHNIPNQAFAPIQVGQNKVEAIHDIVLEFANINVQVHRKKVTGTQRLAGIVFMLTDTMRSRQQIYEKAIKFNPAVKLLIETRMDFNGGRIYTIEPTNINHINEYEKEFYTDEETITPSACGASSTVVATAIDISAHAVWNLINWHNNYPNYNEILLDVQNKNIITRNFE